MGQALRLVEVFGDVPAAAMIDLLVHHAPGVTLKDFDAPVGALAGGGNWGCVAR